jgi:hypothetical protein
VPFWWKTHTHAATAAFLSSLVPGAGQLYNRDWTKAAAMLGASVWLLLAVKTAMAGMVETAAALAVAEPAIRHAADQIAIPDLLLALGHPAVQARARWTLVPPVLGLCVIVLWSMIDAYRHGRRATLTPQVLADRSRNAS